jgi:hypothetical protein
MNSLLYVLLPAGISLIRLKKTMMEFQEMQMSVKDCGGFQDITLALSLLAH